MTFDFTFDAATGHLTITEGSTEIPDGAFATRDEVKSVTIPDSVTSIGRSAFFGNNLTEVVIPDSVTSIGDLAFNFNQLTKVIIGDSVTSIRSQAFRYNELTEVVIPDSVTLIGDSAFLRNDLTEVVIGDSVTSISDRAFIGNNLTEVVIPDSVTSIGERVFEDNNLTEVVIPDSVTSIGDLAFYNNDLTEVVIGDSVTSIGDLAFNSNQLTEVVLPTAFEADPPFSAFDLGVTFTFSDLVEPEPEPEPTPEPEPEPEPDPTPEPGPDPSRGELTEEGWTTDQNSGSWSEVRDAATENTDVDGFSLFVRKGVTANTLGGNDKLIIDNEIGSGLEVKGTLKMGDGHDLIDVRVTNSPFGIENHGKIDMGTGDDVIISTTVKVKGTDTDALVNHKSIKMGDGDDLIDARHGGLGGDGKIKMGKGDDEFSGFGDMKLVDGGKGEDRLRLGAGVYSVTKKGSKFRVAKGIGTADFKSFELVGSYWSRDDEFVDFGFNKDQFGMVIDQHSVTFI